MTGDIDRVARYTRQAEAQGPIVKAGVPEPAPLTTAYVEGSADHLSAPGVSTIDPEFAQRIAISATEGISQAVRTIKETPQEEGEQ